MNSDLSEIKSVIFLRQGQRPVHLLIVFLFGYFDATKQLTGRDLWNDAHHNPLFVLLFK